MELDKRPAGVSYNVTLSQDQADLVLRSAVAMNTTVETVIETIVWAYFNDFVDWLKTISPYQKTEGT